nr:reverse transcriptase domain-containing protein [Tanacetum cinerariifolium]
MHTCSSSNLIVESFIIPKRRNRRRSKQIFEPELRTIVETLVANMADTCTMSKLLQAPIEGHGDAIVIPAIPAENSELKVGLLALVTSSQFHGFERDDPHSHIRWFNKITSKLKYKNVPHDAIKLMLFPFSLEGAAQTTTNLKNGITNFQQRFDETFNEAWDRFKDLLRKCPHHGFLELHQSDTFYNALTQSDQDSLNAAAGGNLLNRTPRDALTIIKNKSKVRTLRNKPVVSKANTTTSSSSPSSGITALTDIVKELVLMNKANQQAFAKAIEETCVTRGGPHPYYECLATGGNTFDACTAVGPYNQGGSVSLPSNTVANPRGDLQAITTRSGVAYDGPTIPPIPSPLPKEVECETKATKEKSLLSNKEKLFELASTPLNENCSVVLLKKLPKKLGDPGKFLFPCDFSELEECLALADLDASINLMPLSVWKKLSLSELTLNRMTRELTNRSIAYPVGVAEDVFMKVRKFYFPTSFVVIYYDVDPQVSLILVRPFLSMTRALIVVHGEELTLRVNDEAIMFKFGHTLRYSHNYYEELVNRIDVIDLSCEVYAQEVLEFLDSSTSGNSTLLDPIIASSSPSFTPFEGSDFILEEIETFLRTPDALSTLDDDFDLEGDIALIENLLTEDPTLNLPQMKNKDLKQADVTMTKPSIEEPPELELKDLPSHLEYAILEGTDKLPIIISKELKNEEKSALLNVLKSHKRAITWKISDIKGIDPHFCTHKILMEDDFKPAVQHQRRVNPKIYEVIKKEVIKLLVVGLIYPIFDSPWVSPVHCVPKKGGMTVFENENNELIPTRLVTGWRVCIDYRKLNDATRKDHFPLPFMDQMIERLTRNEYYCSLDGFLGYFQILIDMQDQKKTTFTCPYGTFAYRRMPLGLCNALGTFQRCMMTIFHDIIEKTMEVFMDDFSIFKDSFSSCLSHLDKMLKRIEVDRAKFNVIAKLPHPTFFKGDLEKKGINETFPLETLGMISFHGDSSTLWFADIANYHAGNFIVKRMSSQQKKKFFKDVKHYFWDDPTCLGFVRIKLFDDVFTTKKPLISLRLAIMDPPGDIMVQITPLRKSLIPVSIGRQFIVMHMTWLSHVTYVNIKEKSHKKTKCLKMQFKFTRSLTCGASTSWDLSRLLEGTSTFSCSLTTCLNGLKRKRSPLMMPELS